MNANKRAEAEHRLAELEALRSLHGDDARAGPLTDEIDALRRELRLIDYDVHLTIAYDPESDTFPPDTWDWAALADMDPDEIGVATARVKRPDEGFVLVLDDGETEERFWSRMTDYVAEVSTEAGTWDLVVSRPTRDELGFVAVEFLTWDEAKGRGVGEPITLSSGDIRRVRVY